jgi:Mg-chelatase subunit ChlD
MSIFRRMPQRQMNDIRAGENGLVVLVVDCSGSMCMLMDAAEKASYAIVKQGLANLRVVAFGNTYQWVQPTNSGGWLYGAPVGGGTRITPVLNALVRIKPARTIVISDGNTHDERDALKAADRMTGEIDALCSNTAGSNAEFMRALARRGGRFLRIDGLGSDLTPEAILGRPRRVTIDHRRVYHEIHHEPEYRQVSAPRRRR